MPLVALRPLNPAPPPKDAPRIALQQLDSLWFQVTGTLCNLACTHCFISCSPGNKSFGFLSYEQVIEALEQSRSLGVKDYYFTGGEPFMHPRLLDMLDAALQIGPATVLTNGTLLPERTVELLAASRDRSIYSLELRVSIDGPDASSNDRIRGAGAFARAMDGVRRLVDTGFLPIITMAQTWDDADTPGIYQRMRQTLLALGYTRPRIKLMPTLRLGAETVRFRGYANDERVTQSMMEGFDASMLICSTSRIVTDRGVHVCPILIEQPDSLLASTLAEAAKADFALQHQACYTCWLHGAICSNASSSSVGVGNG
ncbi:MAG: AdoMet-dependent heme synthase [Phycisphaerales bacterium]|jgi:molybdenum cofactor biosynthesis enzyme MoaA|nr:AdoMet-dependent heme synthase [Phycisphaerales bacterium]